MKHCLQCRRALITLTTWKKAGTKPNKPNSLNPFRFMQLDTFDRKRTHRQQLFYFEPLTGRTEPEIEEYGSTRVVTIPDSRSVGGVPQHMQAPACHDPGGRRPFPPSLRQHSCIKLVARNAIRRVLYFSREARYAGCETAVRTRKTIRALKESLCQIRASASGFGAGLR